MRPNTIQVGGCVNGLVGKNELRTTATSFLAVPGAALLEKHYIRRSSRILSSGVGTSNCSYFDTSRYWQSAAIVSFAPKPGALSKKVRVPL